MLPQCYTHPKMWIGFMENLCWECPFCFALTTPKLMPTPCRLSYAESSALPSVILKCPLFKNQNATGKTCGSWHRLPRRYRRQLRRDEVHAQLTNDDGVVIGGKIGKFYGLSSELFSGLATSTTGRDSNHWTTTTKGRDYEPPRPFLLR